MLVVRPRLVGAFALERRGGWSSAIDRIAVESLPCVLTDHPAGDKYLQSDARLAPPAVAELREVCGRLRRLCSCDAWIGVSWGDYQYTLNAALVHLSSDRPVRIATDKARRAAMMNSLSLVARASAAPRACQAVERSSEPWLTTGAGIGSGMSSGDMQSTIAVPIHRGCAVQHSRRRGRRVALFSHDHPHRLVPRGRTPPVALPMVSPGRGNGLCQRSVAGRVSTKSRIVAPIHQVTPFPSMTPAFLCPYGLFSGSLSDTAPA